jgi:hypothetical protein
MSARGDAYLKALEEKRLAAVKEGGNAAGEALVAGQRKEAQRLTNADRGGPANKETKKDRTDREKALLVRAAAAKLKDSMAPRNPSRGNNSGGLMGALTKNAPKVGTPKGPVNRGYNPVVEAPKAPKNGKKYRPPVKGEPGYGVRGYNGPGIEIK